MKKKLMIIIVLAFTIISACGVFILYQHKQKIKLLKDTFQFEYGKNVKLDGKRVLDTKNKSILHSFTVDYSNVVYEKDKTYPKVGSYTIQIRYTLYNHNINENIKLVVKDTKKPIFTKIPATITIHVGDDLKDLNSYFEAKDASPFQIHINTDGVNVQQAGEYKAEVIAMDAYKNKNMQVVKVIVIENEEHPSSNESHTASEHANENEAVKMTPYTIQAPQYVNGIMIVNKKNPIPYNYAPYENPEAGYQVRELIKEMQNLGYNISQNYSGYRSFDTQAGLYQNYVNNYGQSEADTFSARPGYSEHQTGLAFDLLHNDGSLVENGSEVDWIAQNAHRYGFIVRYKAGKEYITGYQAEPWHIRYVGNIAGDIYLSGLTLEEYLGVQGGGY